MRKITKMNLQEESYDSFGYLQEFYDNKIYNKNSELSIIILHKKTKSKYDFVRKNVIELKKEIRTKIKNIDMLINSNFFASQL